MRAGPGRPKGSLNKFTGELKQVVLDALHNAHLNGSAYRQHVLAKPVVETGYLLSHGSSFPISRMM